MRGAEIVGIPKPDDFMGSQFRGKGKGKISDKPPHVSRNRNPHFKKTYAVLPWHWGEIYEWSSNDYLPEENAKVIKIVNGEPHYDKYELRTTKEWRTMKKRGFRLAVAGVLVGTVAYTAKSIWPNSANTVTGGSSVDTVTPGPDVSFIDAPTSTLISGDAPLESSPIESVTPAADSSTTVASVATSAIVSGDFSTYTPITHNVAPEDGKAPVSAYAASLCPDVPLIDLVNGYVYGPVFAADNPGVNPDQVSLNQPIVYRDCP